MCRSELEHVPDALAGRGACAAGTVERIADALRGDDLVGLGHADLVRDHDVLDLAALLEFGDLRALVLDDGVLDDRVAAVGWLRRRRSRPRGRDRLLLRPAG